MIPFASQRGFGQDLATHLLNAHDNERMEVAEVRGAIAHDLHGAFAEWELQAHSFTKCRKYLYSLSINPDPEQGPLTREQYKDYISRVEEKLGLAGQPRAVVFHQKYGREHCHVIWSRINPDKEKAVHLAFDKEKLMMVTREFARDHGLSLPAGYGRDGGQTSGQLSLYDMHQKRATGLSKEERMDEVTDAWRASDSAKAFVQALAARGYILATGKRPYVLVDLYGEMNALPKLIADKSVRTKDIREFLSKDFPPEDLPTVEEARKFMAENLKSIEAHLKTEQQAEAHEDLKRAQAQRRVRIEKDRAELRQRHHEARCQGAAAQKVARETLRNAHLTEIRRLREERYNRRPQGLAAFLGRVTGIDLLRRKINHYQDRKRLQEYLAKLEKLKTEQDLQREALAQRQKLQVQNLQRQVRALDAIDRREQRALEESLMAEARTAGRNGTARIQAVPIPETMRVLLDRRQIDNIENEFSRTASGRTESKVPPVAEHFARSAKGRDDEERGGSSERTKPDSASKIRRYGRKRGTDKELDKGR